MSALTELMEVLLRIAEHALKKLSVVLSKLLYLPCRPRRNAIFNPERMNFFLSNFAKISGMNCLTIYWFLVAVPILDFEKKFFLYSYTHIWYNSPFYLDSDVKRIGTSGFFCII